MTRHSPTDTSSVQPLASLHGLIICSNSAAGLWPLARQHAPFECIVDPSSGLSPLARAIEALRPYCARPLIIAVPESAASDVKRHIAESALLDDEDYRLLIEPHPRKDALTVALAAATIRLKDSHAMLLCLPATTAFEQDGRWEQALKRAYQAATTGKIALIGTPVAPRTRTTAPHVHLSGAYEQATEPAAPLLGAIRTGAEYAGVEGIRQVRGYIARPAPAVAWRAEQSKALWSSHIYLLGADLALAELRAVGRGSSDPALQSVQRIAETARFFASLGSEHWGSKEAGELVKTLPAVSFEEAVFETTELLLAVPTSIPFTDLTTFRGFEQTLDADAKGNRLRGRALTVQTEGTTVLADSDKLVVALGLDDAVVIDTADATLIARKDALGSMPSVMAALRGMDAPEL
jgi:mannose-1-phosphate guanylyltransferase/mannose-6-phosphate isomerase